LVGGIDERALEVEDVFLKRLAEVVAGGGTAGFRSVAFEYSRERLPLVEACCPEFASVPELRRLYNRALRAIARRRLSISAWIWAWHKHRFHG
jgi:hypothetical protein